MKSYFPLVILGVLFTFYPLTVAVKAAPSQSIEQVTPLPTISIDENTPFTPSDAVNPNKTTSPLTTISLAVIALSLLGMLLSSLGLFANWRHKHHLHSSLIKNA